MSSAVHSEVVELILQSNKFEREAKRAERFIAEMRTNAEKPFTITASYRKLIEEAKEHVAWLRTSRQEMERLNSATIQATVSSRNQAIERQKALLAEVKAQQAAGVPLAGERGRGTGGLNAIELAQLRQKLALRQQTNQEQVRSNGLTGQELAQLQQAINRRQVLLRQEQARRLVAQQTLAIETAKTQQLIRQSAAHRVGSSLAGGKVGALMTGAASGAFLMGASNLGAMFYMMERLSYATGVGHMNMGKLLEKFGLLATTGDKAAQSMANFGKVAMVAGGAVAGLAATFGTMAAGLKIDKGIADMSTLLGDMSMEVAKLDGLMIDARTSAQMLSQAFGVDMTTVISGFRDMLSTGIDPEDLEMFGKGALEMARGMNSTMEQSIYILTTLRDAFNGTSDEVEKYADIIFNAVDVGKFNIAQLNQNLGRVAVTAGAAGISIEDMMAAIATLNRVGMSTSQAITSVNQLLVGILNPSEKAKRAMDQLGVAYGSTALRGRALIDVVSEIKAKVGSDTSMFGEMFGEERARRGIVGLAANPRLYAEEVRPAMDSIGTAAGAAARAMDTFGQGVYKFWLTIWNAIQTTGETMLNVLSRLFRGPDTAFEWADIIAAGLATVGAAINTVVALIVGTLSLFNTLGAVAYNVGATIVNALSLDLSAAGKSWDAIQDTMQQGMMNTLGVFKDLGVGTAATFNGIFGTLATAIRDATGGAVDALASRTDIYAKSASAAFDEMIGVLDKGTDGVTAKMDKLIEKMELARRKMLEAQFESEYTSPTTEARVTPKETEAKAHLVDMYNKMKAVEDALARAKASSNVQELATVFELERQLQVRKEIFAIVQQQVTTAMDEGANARAEARIKEKAEALKKFLEANGIVDKAVKELRIDPTILKEVNDANIVMTEMIRNIEAMPETTKVETQALFVAQARARLELLMETTQELHEQGRLTDAQAAGLQGQYSVFKDMLDTKAKAIKEQQTKEAKDSNDAYIAQIEREKKLRDAKVAHAIEAHKQKMKLYAEEQKRIDSLMGKLQTQVDKMRELMRAGDTTDPTTEREAQRKRMQEAADKIKYGSRDPSVVENRAKEFTEAADKMKAAADKMGEGEQADIDIARETAEIIDRVVKAQEALQEENKRLQEDKKKADTVQAASKAEAGTAMATNLKDNPIFKAVQSEAMQVVQTALATAAKHGIGVTGDVLASVEIGNINANIDINKFKTMVMQIAKEVVENSLVRPKNNNNQSIGSDDRPIGAEPAMDPFNNPALAPML